MDPNQELTLKPGSFRLETFQDIIRAHEYIFNMQTQGRIDAKTADALNTTLKGAVYLHGTLKINYARLLLQAKIKKVDLPVSLAPLGLLSGPAPSEKRKVGRPRKS